MTLEELYPLAPVGRHLTVGSTDARRIAAGEWHELYLEKTGQREPVDLSHVWKPQLGLCTEKLHAWWHYSTTGCTLTEGHMAGNKRFTRPGLPAHHATSIDRWVHTQKEPVPNLTLEMKHTNERASLRSSAEFYMGQLQWQLYILNHDVLRFSIIRGNNEPEWGEVERDEEYINKLVAQVDSFWECVEAREAPFDEGLQVKPFLAAAAKAVKINGFRAYDMEGNNEWAMCANAYVLDKVASEGLKVSEPLLKALVPADASEISGHGVSFKRDARGALRVTISEEVRSYAEAKLAALIAHREELD